MAVFPILFFLTVFLLKFPPFYLLPFQSRLVSSHTLSKGLILVLFMYMAYSRRKQVLSLIRHNTASVLVLVFFIAQSLSVIAATDIPLFLQTYQNSIFAVLLFLLSFLYAITGDRNKTKKILRLFFISCGVFFILFELAAILFPEQFVMFYKQFFQREMVDAYLVNLDRQRISFESNSEVFLPFLIFETVAENRFRIKLFLLAMALPLLSIFSNNRTRFAAMLFAVTASLLYLYKNLKLLRFILLVAIGLAVFTLAVQYSASNNRLNILDRLNTENNEADYDTISFRIKSLQIGMETAASHPLFGIGLGNYYQESEKALTKKNTPDYQYHYFDQVRFSPHNLFAQVAAETGITGLICLTALVVFFVVRDVQIARSGNIFLLECAIASWTVFIALLFNPPQTLYASGWFWFLRGIIEGLETGKD